MTFSEYYLKARNIAFNIAVYQHIEVLVSGIRFLSLLLYIKPLPEAKKRSMQLLYSSNFVISPICRLTPVVFTKGFR